MICHSRVFLLSELFCIIKGNSEWQKSFNQILMDMVYGTLTYRENHFFASPINGDRASFFACMTMFANELTLLFTKLSPFFSSSKKYFFMGHSILLKMVQSLNYLGFLVENSILIRKERMLISSFCNHWFWKYLNTSHDSPSKK